MGAPSASPASDPVLLTQWVFGLVVVLLYARDRFRGPQPLRGTTTFARYWTAQIGYSVSMAAVYVVLAGAGVDIVDRQLLAVLAPEGSNSTTGPLFAALLISGLLPHSPILSHIDNTILEWFRRVGNIPYEVRQLGSLVRTARLDPPRQVLDRLAGDFRDLELASDWSAADTGSVRHRWARLTVLRELIEPWNAEPGYARYMAENRARLAEIDTRIRALLESDQITPRELVKLDKASVLTRRRSRPMAEISALHEAICDFIAGGLLHVERSPRGRYARLARLGIGASDVPPPTLSVHELTLIAGLVFVILLLSTLVARRLVVGEPLAPNVRILLTVPLIYVVAIVSAIYPKQSWALADYRTAGQRPIAGYMASAAIAAVAGMFISLLFRFALPEDGTIVNAIAGEGSFSHAVRTTFVLRWPWLLMTFAITFALAWAADDHLAHPHRSRRELPRGEALGLALVLAVVQWVTLELLRQTDPRVPWMAHAWRMVPMAAAMGAALGTLVPHFYRTRQRHERAGVSHAAGHQMA